MCCVQFLLTTLETGIVDLLSSGALGTGNVTRTLRLAIKDISIELLPEAIGLTDAFGFTDWELDRLDPSTGCSSLYLLKNVLITSALGVYDGKVYEQLWKRAQDEPLNQVEIPIAYEVCHPFKSKGQT